MENFACSMDEAGQAIGIGRTMVFAEAKRGRLKTVKVGRRTLVTRAAINDYVQMLEREAEAARRGEQQAA